MRKKVKIFTATFLVALSICITGLSGWNGSNSITCLAASGSVYTKDILSGMTFRARASVSVPYTFKYQNFKVGEKYTLSARLVNNLTGESIKDGYTKKNITAKKEFIPYKKSGEISMYMTYDTMTDIPEDGTCIAYTLYRNNKEVDSGEGTGRVLTDNNGAILQAIDFTQRCVKAGMPKLPSKILKVLLWMP